jgi:hypothetical protein
MRDRGVSDVVGFVLVFALITASVGVVTVFGISTLEDARNDERVNNAERAFDVLADNFADITRGGAPSRATEIKLAGTSLTIAETVGMSVRVNGSTDPYTANVRPIVFGGESDTEIVYEGGAIIRAQRDGAVMLREPNFLLSPERTVIHYVELHSETESVDRVSGQSTVLVRGVRTVDRVVNVSEGDVSVAFDVETTPKRAPAWQAYCEEELESESITVNETTGTVTCSFETDELYVTSTEIDVAFSS